MRFSFKYLILPLSIMGCINNNCINAMNENEHKAVKQTSMSWVRFESVLTSFQNNEQSFFLPEKNICRDPEMNHKSTIE